MDTPAKVVPVRAGLVPCFKVGQPDKQLWADEAMLRAKGTKLRPWAERNAAPAKAPKQAANKPDGNDASQQADGAPESDNASQQERAALMAEAKALGLTLHHRMTVANMRAKIAEAKAGQPAA